MILSRTSPWEISSSRIAEAKPLNTQIPRAVADADERAVLEVMTVRRVEYSYFAILCWGQKAALSLKIWMPYDRILGTGRVILCRCL